MEWYYKRKKNYWKTNISLRHKLISVCFHLPFLEKYTWAIICLLSCNLHVILNNYTGTLIWLCLLISLNLTNTNYLYMQSSTESEVITGKSQKTPEIIFNICAREVLRGCVHLFTELKQTSLQLMSCTLELWYSLMTLATGSLFWQLLIDHNVDVHYQVKHRMYNVLDT